MSQEERTKSELSIGPSAFQIAQTYTDIGEKQALNVCGTMLEEKHYDLLIDETGMVLTPTGEVLCILLKDRLSPELLEAVQPIVRKAASKRKIAGGRRGVAAGTGMVKRRKRNGQLSKMTGSPRLDDLGDEDYGRLRSATDGVVGYLDRMIGGGQVYPCRLTSYSGALPRELALMGVLAKTVAEAFEASYVQNRWQAQFAKANQTSPTWLLRTSEGITPFTSITCNRNWRTAAHVDKGDLKEGFGVMCCLGDFEGCELVFPRYRTAVRYREGDVLLANVHEVHGNTPLLDPDGSVPTVGQEPERLVCVFYYREQMDQCKRTFDEETEFINKRERGEAMRKKKVAKKK